MPSQKTEDMYIKSVNDTMDDYGKLLHEAANRDPKLTNTDCDTGRDTAPAEYKLADSTYAKLLDELSKKNFAQLTPELRTNILAFY